MSTRAVLAALRDGPMTNAQLQDALCEHSAAISRDCAKLAASGRVHRIDGGRGKGSIAVYALKEIQA